MSEETLSQNQRIGFGPLISLISIVVLLWVGAWVSITWWYPDLAQRGQFGDLFGSVTSLFSGLAFAGIIYTIFLQRGELALQRIELQLTREQLARSAKAQEKSEQSLTKQAQILETTARLNALTSCINSLQIVIVNQETDSVKEKAEKDRWRYIEHLRQELDSLIEIQPTTKN
jgi:hypothetical protein